MKFNPNFKKRTPSDFLNDNNLMILLDSIEISGWFENKDHKMIYKEPVWKIPLNFDIPVSLVWIDRVAKKLIEIYKELYGIDKGNEDMIGFCHYRAFQHIEQLPYDESASEYIKDSRTINESEDEERKDLSINENEEEEKKGFKRPNYGIGRQMRAFWSHQKYNESIKITEVYDLFKSAFPKLEFETFVKYLKNRNMRGQVHLTIDEVNGFVTKVDNSPMK